MAVKVWGKLRHISKINCIIPNITPTFHIMKKNILLFFGMLLCITSIIAQNFVSTVPSKRNALVEEYTGVGCQYCPLGHKAIDQTLAAFPGRAFAINIHQGTFASQYTTQWGNALAAQAGITGYPSSSMNRHVFSGGNIHIDPGQAYQCASEVTKMDAPVNVAATVEIDEASRLMVVKVQAYYTGNASNSINLLNVALLQNNVLSYQAGASTWYPENMVGGQYRHKHILRHLLTGQWGDTIPQTTAGTFISKEYAYVLPHSIGGLDIDNMNDLSVLVFICENHQEVLNVCEAIRVGGKAYMAYGDGCGEECALAWYPTVTVVNPTNQPVHNLRFTLDGTTIVRDKTIAPYCFDTVRVTSFSIDNMPTEQQIYSRTSHVTMTGYTSVGTNVNVSDALDISYGNAEIFTVEGPLTLSIRYDNYPTEVSYSLAGMNDCLYYYQGHGASADVGSTRDYTFSPATAGLYRLKVYDTGGDGLNGTVTVKDAQGNTLFSRNGNDLMVWDHYYFNITNAGTDNPQGPVPTSIEDLEALETSWAVWPNPVSNLLYVRGDAVLQQIDLLDVSGRILVSAEEESLSVAGLPSGLYILRIIDEDGVTMKKIIKK